MTTISAEDLTIAYEQRTIIDKLSFYIPEGKITTIIGANGCGKSSLLKALTRLLPPKQGVVYLNGQNIATLETKEVAKKLALLPQVQEATNGITVYELVSYGRFPHQSYFGNLSPADKKAIHWAMQATNVMAYADQPVDALSGGQRQRVWLAMALAQGTDTIFLDEPTTYLDLNHQLEILELVKSLNKDAGKTIVMVLHDLNLSARYSDHLIAMKHGKIHYTGTIADVMTSPIIQDIFQIKPVLVDDPIHNCPIVLTYHLQ
ncbi:TPA: ABC transporter ATP-binding protein [Streptococcus pyogenes]|nr:ABC transporter ATP-binding protein [Streptococcus pyogenes]HEQ3932665.1 ABC transporter ATP-binding protein [Streptococcus pyogenes]HEQ9983179.1 ABC transporter ATP-binding protein [Streptococcus pyogenes]